MTWTLADLPEEPDPEPTEWADQYRPELVRRAIDDAVSGYLADVRVEVWRRRRERMLTYLHIVEGNLDYDLGEQGSGKPA